MKYRGHTGRTVKFRFKEHIQTIRDNKRSSKYTHQFLDRGYVFGAIDIALKIFHIKKNGAFINTEGKFRLSFVMSQCNRKNKE
jgi:hypothetical protein